MKLYKRQIFCISLTLLLSFSTLKAQEDLSDLVVRIKPSVVTLITFDAQGTALSQGSGFCIAPGLVVTNFHVVKNASHINVILSDRVTRTAAKIIASDETADLVILDTNLAASQLLPVSLASSLPKEGERIFVISNPKGLEGTVSDGIVSAIRQFRDAGMLIQMTAPISPGSSGGPVMNLRGQVIGVAVGAFKDGQSLNFVIPTASVNKLKSSIPESRLLPDTTVSAKSAALSDTSSAVAIPTFPSPDDSDENNKIIKAYRKAIELAPEKSDAYLKLSSFLNREMETRDEALRLCQQVIKLNPRNYEGFKCAGDASGLDEKAVGYYKQALRLKPNDIDLMGSLATSLYINEQYEDAVVLLRECIKRNPKDASNYSLLVYSLIKSERYNEAFQAARQLIKLHPDKEDGYSSLGEIYSALEKYTEAIEAYKKAVSIEPDNPSVHIYLGEAYYNSERYREAVEAYEMAKQLSPVSFYSYIGLGNAYLKAGRFTDAINEYNEAIRRNSNDRDAYAALGLAYSRMREYDKALAFYNKALEGLNPGTNGEYWYASVRYNIGLIYINRGDREAALKQYKILKKIDEEYATKLFNIIYK